MTDLALDQEPQLRRELKIWEAIGISLALMAPSMAANINPQGTASVLGRAVPLGFLIAMVGVLLVSYTFVQLTRRFHHSGSVYGFVGATLGAGSGVVSGWGVAGTYIFYAVTTGIASGRFAGNFLSALGIWHNPPDWGLYLLTCILLVPVWMIANTPARGGTRLLMIVEATTVTLILIVCLVIFVKLTGHSGPSKLGVDWSVFKVPSGTNTSTVFLGAVFGFLSFAGFEAAATLGEEAQNPNRDIPRAILGVALFGGAYYVIVTAIESMGFGTSDAGVKAFVNSTSLLGDLGSSYISSWIGNLITFGAMISALSCALACVVGSSRLIYALCRDGIGPKAGAAVSSKNGIPTRSVLIVMGLTYAIILVMWLPMRASNFEAFLQTGTIGTLILLVAYILATIGMAKVCFFGKTKLIPMWQVIVPVAGVAMLLYTIYRNIYPWPVGVNWCGPAFAAAWLAIGIIIVVARPSATKAANARLAEADGLKIDASV